MLRRQSRESAMNERIREALIQLTGLRKRVLEASDVVGRLFASLSNDTNPAPSRDELEQAEKDLERQVPGFYVWFEPRHARYVLVPKSDQENRDSKE
jgi:hypothetical protein